MIVISFGLASGNQSQLLIASLGALFAVATVAGIGAVVAKPLAKVPENYMKLGVGIMLTVFGLFWMGEGVGVQWPFSDLFILALLAIIFLASLTLVAYLKRVSKHMTEAKA